MSTAEFNAATALDWFSPNKTTERPARVWSLEALAQRLAALGIIELFEGAGNDPTALTGYASNKLWGRWEAGVTDAPGTVRAYVGTGDEDDIANWPVMTRLAFGEHVYQSPALSMARLGINTPSDATNKLSVKSDTVLFSHDDVTPGTGDHIMKINKSATARTASYQGQVGFSTRFELGLAGDDDATFKVSANGTDFETGWKADKDTGKIEFPNGTDTVPFLMVEWYGATAYTKAELEALDGGAAVATQAATNATAFQAALDAAEALGGYDVVCAGQIYVLNARLNMPQGVRLIGRGTDEWEPVYPTRPKLWDCTSLLFKGTGTADITFDAVTSMKNAGGWPEDPDNGGQYFKLFSAYNADASGTTAATQRTFSAAIAPKNGDKYWGLRDLRIVNWSGDNGIEGWSDTGSSSLGDDWDIGVLLLDTEYVMLDNVQVVGGWREFALLHITEEGAQSANERNSITNCKLQGRVGLGLRAMDRWEINATTSNSVTVTWSNEHYFSTGGGTFRGSDDVTYTYTGLSFSSPNLTLTGVTPDPDAAGIFHLRHAGSGFANTQFVNTYVYDIFHQSGDDADTLGLSDSKALEMSGFPLRGVAMRNCKFHGGEPVLVQMHDVFDLRMWGCQFEGGGHVIASPVTTASGETAPAGETRALFIDGDDGFADQDDRLFLPRSAFVQSLQVAPEDDLTGAFQLRALRANQDIEIRQRGTGGIVLKDNNGDEFMDLTAHVPTPETPVFSFVTAPTYTFQYGWYRQISPTWFEFGIEMHWTGLDTSDTSTISILPPGKTALETIGALITTSLETTGWTLSGGLRLVGAATNTYLGVAYANGTPLAYNGGAIPAAGMLRAAGFYSKT